jgi:hypothetical protein
MRDLDPFFAHYAECYMAGTSTRSGGLLKDFHTMYHLLRVDGDWPILSYTNHDGLDWRGTPGSLWRQQMINDHLCG